MSSPTRTPMLETLLENLRRTATDDPRRIAVRDGQVTVSYAALAERVSGLSAALRQRGIGAGDRVGLLCDRGLAALAGMLAAIEAGAAYVPLDPSLPPNRLAFVAQDAAIAYLLAERRLESRVPTTFAHHVVDHDATGLGLIGGAADRRATPARAVRCHPEDAAYVLYTSGSTGRPKGVVVPRRALANYLEWSAGAYGPDAWDAALVSSSLAVDLTVTPLFLPLWTGRTVVLLPADDPIGGVVRELQTERRALVKLAPSQLALLLPRLTTREATRVASLVIGGEALPADLVRWWRRLSPGTRVFNEYGPTEATVGCTAFEVRDVDPAAASIPIGAAIAGVRVAVLDTALQPVGDNAVAELCIGGAGLAHGYAGRASLTAARFIPDAHASAPGSRIYRTGDLARRRADGVLEYLGRADDQMKVHGHRVEPGDVEAALRELPGVSAAAVALRHPLGVTGTPARQGENQSPSDIIRRFTKPEATAPDLVAWLVFEPGASVPTCAEVRRRLAERLPAHMIPARFVSAKTLPLLPSGKLDRAALVRTPGDELSPAAAGAAPRNDTEAALCQVVRDVLGIASVGIHDNFFEMGLDSIRVIRVHAAARALGVSLELADFFKHQTIAQLSERGDGGPIPGPSDRSERRSSALRLSAADAARLPDGVEDAYPLARMQSGLIFHSLEAGGAANYHDVFVYAIRSRFDEGALAAALAGVVERHPALRTSFALGGFTEPLQLVWRGVTVPLAVSDLRALAPDRQRDAIASWIAEEKDRRFDFAAAPLLRLHVHRTADDVAHWGVSFHDSIMDGWSVATFLAELVSRYAARLEGQTLELPALAVSYRQFVERERDVLADAEQRGFWRDYLAGGTVRLPAAPGRRRPAPRVLEVPIPPDLSDDLQAVARMLRVPLKHVLLAVHVHVIGLTTGQRDVVTGLESNGRLETADGDRVLGMHLNTVPLRVRMRGGTWADLIDAVHEGEHRVLPYRRYPYASIHKEHEGASLFDAIFNFTHFHVLKDLSAIAGIEPLGGYGFGQRHYALSAEFNQDPFTGDVRLDLECNQAAAGAAQWEEVARAYQRALRAVATDPMSRYDALGIEDGVGEAGTDAPAEMETGSVLDLWLEQVARAPGAIAVAAGARLVSYAELAAASATLAARLTSAGVGPERRVGIFLEPGVGQIVAVLGTLLAGGAYVPLDPDLPPARVAHIIRDAGVCLVITAPALRERLGANELQDVEWLLDPECEAAVAAPLAPRVHPQQLAYVIYTSGSTGTPKGVHVAHGTLAYSTLVRLAYYHRHAGTFLLVPSLAYDSSVAVLYWSLCSGGTLVMPSRDARRDPARLLEAIRRHRVTTWLSVPALYEAVLRQSRPGDLESLTCAIVAGEKCPATTAALHVTRCAAELFNEYGPSEATVWATVHKGAAPAEAASVPIGRALDGTRVYVLDEHLRPAPAGVAGEIYIGGRGVSRGYGVPSATASRFVPDPFGGTPGGRMYRTGDLARQLTDEGLEFLGRVDRQVKIRGYRVEPAEIEDALRRARGVRDVAVVAAAGRGAAPRLIAYVVADPPAPGATELKRHCAGVLPAALVPASFVFLDELPRTENGKVDARWLEELGPALQSPGALQRVLAEVEAMDATEVVRQLDGISASQTGQGRL